MFTELLPVRSLYPNRSRKFSAEGGSQPSDEGFDYQKPAR
jgi:hypothetical protein